MSRMKVTAYKTPRITPKAYDLLDLIDNSLPALKPGSVVAIASKIVSLCEGRVVAMEGVKKEDLIAKEATHYLPHDSNPYNVFISITRNTLIASGGIDESNGGNFYVLWPADAQASANMVRENLVKKCGHKDIGVILTDSTTRPLQWGTTGIAIACSGLEPLHSYVGQEDLFGRKLKFQKNNIQNGLAAAAVLIMGEGSEQTPLVVIEDVPFVKFTHRNPTQQELDDLQIDIETDLFAPILKNAPWISPKKVL